MTVTLVVVRPFAGLSRGDSITDPRHIGAVLASEHAADVVRVVGSAPGRAAAEPAPARDQPGQPAIPETQES